MSVPVNSDVKDECPFLAYCVEELVCEMSDFAVRVSMRSLRSG